MTGKNCQGHEQESGSRMSADYKEHLSKQLNKQAGGELLGAYIAAGWVERAPSLKAKFEIAELCAQEIGHALMIYELLTELGNDVDRLACETLPVDYFSPYPATWIEFVVFHYLIDSAARHLVSDLVECSWAPAARVMQKIYAEEDGHVEHAELWIEELCAQSDDRTAIQKALDDWLPRIGKLFGKPQCAINQARLELGIQRYENESLRTAWYEEVRATLTSLGLMAPATLTCKTSL